MTDNNIKTNINTTTDGVNGNSSINNHNVYTKHKSTEKNNLKLIIPAQQNDVQQNNKINRKKLEDKTKKKKHRDKSDLGDNFVAPDGGWGWLVAVASGVNILVTFALAQQFGIIFRDYMYSLGISGSQLMTIINTQVAVSAFTGLLNGPLFRRYTFRQVALVGSVLTFIGLFLSAFASSFGFYVVSFSCFYGFGRGLTTSASSLAVNTYFRKKRRTATSYQFGVAGLGPIVFPYLATFLLQYFGVKGTVLIFSSMSLHTIACSLIYQPVLWHVKKIDPDQEAANKAEEEEHEEEEEIACYADPETPVLPRANDGWFGSRTSLNSLSNRNRINSWDRTSVGSMRELRRLSSTKGKPRTFSLSHSIKEEQIDEEFVEATNAQHKDEHINEETKLTQPERDNNDGGDEACELTKKELHLLQQQEDEEREIAERKKLPFYKKVAIFFDLDLLRDLTYVNLAVGITLINFVEINFAILTPFILSDFGFDSSQIALAMSSLGFCDLIVRFLIPLITAKINLSNKMFFAIGITGMCIGRALLSFTRDYHTMVGIFIFMGLNKGFRTVFWSLIIAGCVPLKRLPAAAGLQLLLSGMFSLACGPLIGLIRDNTSYRVTVHVLNALCISAIIMWLVEDLIRYRQRRTAAAREKAVVTTTANSKSN